MVRKFLTMLVVLGAALAGHASAGTAGASFDDIVVFGDSLSDSGNAGRFSNGPVWVELIARGIGAELRPSRAGGTNYAVGGARTHGGQSDLRSQLHAYLSNAKPPRPETLFVIYGGANDLLVLGCGKNDRKVVKTAAAAIAASVDDLAAAGAKTILVPNLPDIGLAPIVRMQGAACREQARRLSRDFNAALERQLRAAELRHGIRLVRLDVFALGDEVMADPAKAGFADTDTPCVQGECERALFWDHLHPSSRAHSQLAAAALHALGIAAEH